MLLGQGLAMLLGQSLRAGTSQTRRGTWPACGLASLGCGPEPTALLGLRMQGL